MLSFEQCGSIVEEQLNLLSIGNKAPAGLYKPVEHVISAGGKRVRPALALMACNIFSDDIEKALIPAVALELFHNFTLLHDDLMDDACVRRNRITVNKLWCNNVAILSGDAMMILAYQHICRAEQDILPVLLDVFNRVALDVCEGQQYDMDFEQRINVTVDEYMQMIRLKTGALLAASLKTGAICGGANYENIEALYNFGMSLGISFQIQDDWLDLYSDACKFGKLKGGDIINGKKTFLMITALERADKKSLMAILHDKIMDDVDKINSVKEIFDSIDVSDIALQTVAKYHKQAMNHLREVAIPDKSRITNLEQFAEKLLKREK